MFDSDVIKQGIKDESILEVMREVDRQNFVPKKYSDIAYEDRAIPIGEGQTISQPFIVAFMTENLKLKPGHKVLEVGTGSGFQTAVLSKLGTSVVSIEINEVLAKKASTILSELGYKKISLHHGDGNNGVSEHAPYDRILVAAASNEIPKTLLDQLSINGRMIIPIGKQSAVQHLWLITKNSDGEINKEKILPVHFVPMING